MIPKYLGKQKKKKKEVNVSFSLGPKKLQMLIDCGIHTGRQLIQLYDSMPNDKINLLKTKLAGKDKVKMTIIKGWTDSIKSEIAKRETAMEEVQNELRVHDESEVAEVVVQGPPPPTEEETPPPTTTVPQQPTTALPKFSKMLDREGYNARFLSTYMVEYILQTYF